jgi:sulfoacetaldehyde dehydrogenase
MARAITEEEKQLVQELVGRAHAALKQIADYDQMRVDRLIRAVGWALSNEKTFTRLSNMGVDDGRG